jgi:hypothetical protein
MAKIFVAASSDDIDALARILGEHHQLCFGFEMSEAIKMLSEPAVDLVLVGVHFDESRMFDLLRHVPEDMRKPIICFCTRDTPLTRTMHDSIQLASQALGAWMYIDQHEYNVTRNPDAEMRHVIERCLTADAQRKTQAGRKDIQNQRAELQRLREALEQYEWSDNLEERVLALRQNLNAVLLDLCQLQVANLNQQEEIASSRERKDRILESINQAENGAMREDRRLFRQETNQTVQELEIGKREEIKRRRKS